MINCLALLYAMQGDVSLFYSIALIIKPSISGLGNVFMLMRVSSAVNFCPRLACYYLSDILLAAACLLTSPSALLLASDASIRIEYA